MGKERSRFADYLVYLVVRFVVCIIQTLSYEAACKVARGLAWLAYRVDKRHRLVADANLRQAFPERYKGKVPLEEIRAIYRHFCNLMIEIVHLPRRLHPTTWRRHLDLQSGRQFVEALLSDRPLLLVTGHFGNWEVGGYALALLGFKTHAIARPLDNPYCDDFLRHFRERTGQGILAKKGDFDQMQAILAKGGVLATLADQDAGQRGLFVDFFGKPASTHKAVALLALEYKVPMLVMGVRKIGEPMRFQTVFADFILPEDYEGQPNAVKAITQRYTTALERVVRTAPDQYFWLHRRWKHQPAKSRKQAA
ncbi:MAG: lysophospholipid acyltransferase family protein [Gemmataceae bacterium]